MDLIDFAGWQDIPDRFEDRPIHTHNKLVKNTFYNADERREIARETETAGWEKVRHQRT